MLSLESTINELRGRLPLYIGSNSISNFSSFLHGFVHAIVTIGSVLEDPTFLEDFQVFVEKSIPYLSREVGIRLYYLCQ